MNIFIQVLLQLLLIILDSAFKKKQNDINKGVQNLLWSSKIFFFVLYFMCVQVL